jgi:tRNA(Ile)-lysidine synthetase-like protein
MSTLVELYSFWFSNQDMWFNASKENDSYITDKFKELFWIKGDKTELSRCESIAYIILYDQVTRHIYRDNTVLNKNIINNNLTKIIPFAKTFYEKNKGKLNAEEFCFVLLPFRHVKDYTNFMFVVNQSWDILKNNELNTIDKNQIVRFITASYERYAKFAIDYDLEQIMIFKPSLNKDKSSNAISPSIASIIDKCCNFSERIVEFNQINKTSKFSNILSHLDKKICYILSLSGGVDSMVLSYLLKSNGFNFVAVHISYQNRPECATEIMFLKEWCQILNCTLYTREIHEINRKDCMDHSLRELYESYTRDIRFNTYKIVGKLISTNGDNLPHVFLGHNNDDRFENIMTNIASQSHYDNLTGMDTIQNISSIEFHRPLLEITKKDIYAFAHERNIFHLHNSTPAWSQRGKIRDKVKPTLIEWNPKITDSLFKLSSELSSYVEFIKQSANIVIQEIKTTQQIKMKIMTVCYLETFWNIVFQEFDIWISTKSNKNFVDKLKYIKNRFDTFELNVLEKINLNKTTQIKWKKINTTEFILYF